MSNLTLYDIFTKKGFFETFYTEKSELYSSLFNSINHSTLDGLFLSLKGSRYLTKSFITIHEKNNDINVLLNIIVDLTTQLYCDKWLCVKANIDRVHTVDVTTPLKTVENVSSQKNYDSTAKIYSNDTQIATPSNNDTSQTNDVTLRTVNTNNGKMASENLKSMLMFYKNYGFLDTVFDDIASYISLDIWY